ncbi:MAG: hypothetical protein JWM18_914 [Chloroflexi bacterium]|nr:hypothetical protein [Chloroflexota bacterium]
MPGTSAAGRGSRQFLHGVRFAGGRSAAGFYRGEAPPPPGHAKDIVRWRARCRGIPPSAAGLPADARFARFT